MTRQTPDLQAALRQARTAQAAWAALPLAKRLEPVARLRARLAREPEALAEIVAAEIGKTRFEAIGSEILPAAEACRFLLKRAPAILAPRGETLRGTLPFTGRAVVRRVPWGVVAILVPWNYPLYLCASPALHALVAGNAVALKASPRARQTVQALGEWLWEAGIPRDLLAVLDSSDETGRELAASPLIDRIVFTGSSRTGRSILAAAAASLVPATVELSGCDAAFVLSDASLELAADGLSFGLRLNAGRTCVCPRSIFVEEPVAARFIGLFSAKLSARKLLAPMDPQTLREADELAAKLSGAGAQSLNGRSPGDAERAVIVAGGAEALAVAQGNFVPAAVVARVAGIQEALRLEGASPYALGASIYTRSAERAWDLAERLRAGMVTINESVTAAGEAALPFGGCGESGYGVRGGEEGLLEMTRPQTLAFARGSFRPHHAAGTEAEGFIRALLRARHSGNFFSRAKGWLDFALAGARWRPPKEQ